MVYLSAAVIHPVEQKGDSVDSSRSPVVAGWELALRLRRRREELGLDVKAITDELGFSRNYWSAVENERKLLSEENLNKVIDLFQFDRKHGQELLDLRAAAREHSWPMDYAGLFDDRLQRLFGVEDGADSVRIYESLIMPGLLQTPEYARAIITPAVVLPRVEVEQRVKVRQRRQQRLTGERPLRLTAVISEAVLRQQIGGPTVLRQQLEHLVDITEAHPDTIDIRVIPFTARSCGLFGSATVYIFDFENPLLPTIAWQETVTTWGFIEDQAQIRDLVATFNAALTSTLSTSESVAMIRRHIRELA
ncbi:MAG TPA: Scr1 family TA system antitoxin-like transcriptional regulator [Pseudonocardiaceae bacterium]|nr:Scr1 family TA system antitoxin-like transcriptional regulator [Pseudonocardiaceae bacterium]